MKLNGKTTNQKRCVEETCTNETLRDSGCFLCSNEHGGERCVTCIEEYISYFGTCIKCSQDEECLFNGTRTAKCKTKYDSHCGFGVIGCRKHECDMNGIWIMVGCSLAVVIIPSLVVAVVFIAKKMAYMGYIKLNHDPLFSDAFDGIELIESFIPVQRSMLETFLMTDYKW